MLEHTLAYRVELNIPESTAFSLCLKVAEMLALPISTGDQIQFLVYISHYNIL
jgi:hypothetical protein